MVDSFMLLAMDDQDFLSSFERCTLPKEHFNHAGHVRLAWLYLERHPFDEAVTRTCDGIRAYAAHLGAADKFHRTITEALMHLLRAHGRDAVLADARGMLALHYSPSLLAEAHARERFVPPDREPLP
ncbi:MAG TPA: hypothetical protein VGF27_01315 [Pseudoduganella sp.]